VTTACYQAADVCSRSSTACQCDHAVCGMHVRGVMLQQLGPSSYRSGELVQAALLRPHWIAAPAAPTASQTKRRCISLARPQR
jgi:hypothetical protein